MEKVYRQTIGHWVHIAHVTLNFDWSFIFYVFFFFYFLNSDVWIYWNWLNLSLNFIVCRAANALTPSCFSFYANCRFMSFDQQKENSRTVKSKSRKVEGWVERKNLRRCLQERKKKVKYNVGWLMVRNWCPEAI